MLRAVIRVEWASALRERPLWILLAIFAIFVGFAAFGSAQIVRAERASAEAATRAEAARLAELSAEAEAVSGGAAPRANADPTDPLAVGQELLPRVASLPLAPLAPVAIGQRDVLPQTLHLTTRSRFTQPDDADTASPARRAAGPFDLAFVLVFLLPLVVIAASFDLLAAEREGGTLALVLSQPISLTTFVLGKAALRAMLLVALAVVLSILGALSAGAHPRAPGGLTALALCVALIVSYTLFWLALALAVNAWGRSSAANALALVGAWLALVVVVPGLGSVAVDTLYPSPSRVELVNLTREAAREASARASEIEGDHGKPSGDEATKRKAIEVQADLERRVEPVLSGFEARLAEQQALVDGLRFTSPALLMNEGLTEVAGSGVHRHQQFTRQVDAFHEELKRFFHERVESSARLRGADYDAMPRFDHVEQTRGAMAGRVASSALGILAMAAALLGAALAGLRRNFSRGLR